MNKNTMNPHDLEILRNAVETASDNWAWAYAKRNLAKDGSKPDGYSLADWQKTLDGMEVQLAEAVDALVVAVNKAEGRVR
jgi:hypothetical protein